MRHRWLFAAVFFFCSVGCDKSERAQPSEQAPNIKMGPQTPPALATERCVSCHSGKPGENPKGTPHLAGQLAPFLRLQLTNFKSGERKHPVMTAIAASLTRDEIEVLVRYYAELPQPAKYKTWSNDQGRKIYEEGTPTTAPCQGCHGEQGRGVSPAFPLLAGQDQAYVAATLRHYQTKDGFGNPWATIMKTAIMSLSDEQVEAVSAYLASLR